MWLNRNISLLVVVHLCVACAGHTVSTDRVANEFRYDYNYIPEAGGWLKLHRVPLAWHAARTQCYHEGAVLASPLNAELWSALKKFLSEISPGVARVFSGVHATFSDGVYSSVEGIPLEKLFVEWMSDEPNNFDNRQQCLAYERSGMADENCERLLPYFCYRKLSIADELTECGTVDKEYKVDARTGHCYKFHARAEPWVRAFSVCQAEGGHLAVIDDEPEAAVLKDLFSKHERLLYTPYQNSAAVGFKEWGGYNNSWWTIHGKLLEDTEYAQWSQGQPDNAPAPGGRAGRQACGAIFRSAQLDDVWCDEPLAFICEKTKHSLIQINDDLF